MATEAFESIVEDFEFLDDWEDRYAMVIDMGKQAPGLDAAFKVSATKVDGCATQVWLVPRIDGGVFHFDDDSDGLIVKGVIAVLQALYNGVPLAEVGVIDAQAELGRLKLEEHLSGQRTNGLRAMVDRIRSFSAEAG